MRSVTINIAAAAVVLLGWIGIVCAAGPPPPVPNGGMPGMSQGACAGGGAGNPLCDSPQMRFFEYYSDIQKKDNVTQSKEWDKETAKKDSQKLIADLALPCELTDAERTGGGKVKVEGRLLDVKVYEVACRAGNGYFLVSQQPQKPLAVSCFAAEAARVADIAHGQNTDDFGCRLSGYDVKAMAASVLKGAGTECDVKDYRWVGISRVSETEYSEVACANGQGYVVEVPSAQQVAVVGCQDALKEGVKCNLTAVTLPVTLESFRDALKEHAVDCAPAQIRYIGRETQGRRYVVELQCPQKPGGLVAFIPLEGNSKPFETLDCPAAVARAVKCTLTAKQ